MTVISETKADRALALMVATIVAGAAVLLWAGWQVVLAGATREVALWLGLALLTVLTGTHTIKIPGTKGALSASETILFITVIQYGVPPAVLISSLDAFLGTRRVSKRKLSILFSTATMALSIFLAGSCYRLLIRHFFKTSPQQVEITDLIWPLMILAGVHFLVNSGLISAATGLRYRKPIGQLWRTDFSWTAVAYLCSASIAGILFYLFNTLQPLAAFAIIVLISPVLGIIYFSYKTYAEKSEEKLLHIREISKVHLSTIECLATAIDAKDQVTHGHIRRVQIFTLEMGRLLNVSELEMEGLRAAALLHDIGKIGVPEYILNKPAKLTPNEYEKIKTHAVIGAEILGAVEFPYPVIPGVLHHHERWDGKGYPSGLKGPEIPLAARILTLTDFFDALTSDRPYRKAMSREKVLSIIQEESGKMFDPRLAELFCQNVELFESKAKENGVGKAHFQHRFGHAVAETAAADAPPQNGLQSIYDRISSAQQEMLTFLEITRNLGSSLEMRDILDIVDNKLEKLVPYTDLVIYLCDKASDQLVAAHASGPHHDCFRDLKIPRGQGVSGWALANHRSLVSANPALDVDASRLDVIQDLKNVAVFPLYREQENLGCISLYSREVDPLSADHVRILQTVCQQVSEALANAVLFESTRTKSLTDPLTGLPNSRYLHASLEQLLARSDSEKQTLSLVAMDLDEFEKINDLHGHKFGDELLRDLAVILRRNLREADELVRYAGDAFVLVLPRTSLLEAQMSVSRLQEVVTLWGMDLEAFKDFPISLSAGCSCFPEDGQSMEELLQKADRRMYDDKRQRKQKPSGVPVALELLEKKHSHNL